VAAKHDGKKARANHWVMQQNLAKQKGGRPGYQFTEKKPAKPPAKQPAARPPSKAADAASAPPADEPAPPSDATDASKTTNE
jgi:hypothetical protein